MTSVPPDAEGGAAPAPGGDARTRRDDNEVGPMLGAARNPKPVHLVLDGVGRLWPIFIVLVIAVAIAGEAGGPDAAAVVLSGGGALCVILVGLATRLDPGARGITALVATGLGIGTATILTFWDPGTADSRNNAPTSASTQGTPRGRADLSGARLRGADLAGAQLVGADLRGADLKGACLRGANLRAADVAGADFGNADLRGAVVEGVETKAARNWPSAEQQENSAACQ